ncbi:MAG: hypothetical protein AB9903_29235 [Vulcanimicrobiota bacterium]
MISIFLFLLPGLLLMRLFRWKKDLDWLETVPFISGISLVFFSVIAFLSFFFHLSLEASAVMFCVMCVVMAAFAIAGWWRERRVSAHVRPSSFFDSIKASVKEQSAIYLVVPSFIALTVVVLMALRLEMPSLGQEDGVLLMMAQKIRSLPSLSIDNLYFRPGTVFAYIVPLYSFLLAFLSALSGLETVQLYCLSRGVLSFLSIVTVYGIARALFPSSREFPWYVILLACAAAWSGWGIDFTGQAFGQFLPFPQYQDVALAVLLPMAFMFFLHALSDKSNLTAALCVVFTSLLLFIHAREFVIALMLYAAALAGLILSGGGRPAAIRASIIIAVLLAVGFFIYRFQSQMVAPGVHEWNRTAAQALLDQGISSIRQGGPMRLFYPPLRGRQLLPGYNMVLMSPYYLMALLLMPLFLLKRQERGLSMLAVIFYGVFAAASVPVVTLILLRFSYSQFLVGAPVTLGLFPFVFIASAWALWKCCALLVRLPAPCRLLFLLIPFCLVIPQWIYRWSPLFFTAWVLVVPIFILLYSTVQMKRMSCGGSAQRKSVSTEVTGAGVNETGAAETGESQIGSDETGESHIGSDEVGEFPVQLPIQKKSAFLVLLLCAAIMLACDERFFFAPCGLSPAFPVKENSIPPERKTLIDEYRYASSKISVRKWEKWYQKSSYSALSLPLVEFMRRSIPAGSVFAAPGDCLMAISVMTPQHVYTSGSYISLMTEPEVLEKIYSLRTGLSIADRVRDDRGFREEILLRGNRQALSDPGPLQYYAALTVLVDETMMGEAQPFFNAVDTPEIRKAMLNDFNIDYLLLTEKWRKAPGDVVSSIAGDLEIVYDDGHSVIYRIKKRKLSLRHEKQSTEWR